MTAIHPSMSDLYRRLEAAGLDRPFLRRAVLPDWWEDRLASDEVNRELAELYVAKSLALRVADLRNPTASLTPLPVGDVRFKRSRRAKDEDRLRTTALIGRRVGEILPAAIHSLPVFACRATPAEVRGWILARHQVVSLRGLLDFCWSHGIIVFHLSDKSKGYQIEGMATFCGDVPVIMLGSNRQPAWLTFHAAHELEHILRGHVSPGGGLLVDSDLSSGPDQDPQEIKADRGAMEIIAGAESPHLPFPKQISPANLARSAQAHGVQECIEPGVLCLAFAFQSATWSLAAAALRALPTERESASAIIQHALRARLDTAELSEAHARFLDTVLG